VIAGKSILAVIPARGGSKGLPRKNILPLSGKPLIAWSIEAAKESQYIDKFIVSTDDKEIADVAKLYDCEIPFLRPDYLALDDTPSSDVIIHSIEYFAKKNIHFDYFILLEPTSPLRNSQDIDRAMEILNANREKADSIVGVSKVEAAHPVFDVRINATGLIEPYKCKNFELFKRQDIEPLYFFEGTIYISDTKVFLKQKSFYHERSMPYNVPRWKSLEIDNMLDLLIAETLIKNISILKDNDD